MPCPLCRRNPNHPSTTGNSPVESDVQRIGHGIVAGSEIAWQPHAAGQKMIRIRPIAVLTAIYAIAIFSAAIPRGWAQTASPRAAVAANPTPTPEQVQSLMARAAENQHRDDRAIEEFDRVEHVVTRKTEGTEILTDRTDRVIPSGTGTMKVPIAENGMPVSQEATRHALEYAVNALELALHPTERYKEDLAKFQKRQHDHAEFLDTAVKAFRITWAGRETLPDSTGAHGSRTLAKLILEPDPNYKPPTRMAVTFQHVRATLWVDETQAQFARLEGDIASDITFAGGIAGKINQGGHFMMEQAEVEPGVWLPTVYTYDVDGRKFLFAFGVHERTEITGYRRVGPPAQSIEIIRNELKNLPPQSPAKYHAR
jgi:hypothetical protein